MDAIAGKRWLILQTSVRAWRPSALALEVGGSWIATRLALFSGAYLAALLAARLGAVRLRPGWDHWDTSWYVSIAQHGYTLPRSVNFFPLFPGLIAGVARLFTLGAPPSRAVLLWSALAVANLATLAALAGLVALVSAHDGPPVAMATVRLLLAYPLAFFLAAGYSDGPFLAASVLALLAARRRRWGWAALAALAAGGLRPTAPILVLPLAWELFFGGERPPAREVGRGLLAIFAVPAAWAGFALFTWARFGDPLLFLRTQAAYWHHVAMPPWTTLALAVQHLAAGHAGLLPLDLSLLAVFAVLTVAMAGRLPAGLVVYCAGLLLLVLVSPVPGQPDLLQSAGRYLLAAFPAFWLAGRWCAHRPWVQPPLLAAGLLLQGGLLLLFLVGGPAY